VVVCCDVVCPINADRTNNIAPHNHYGTTHYMALVGRIAGRSGVPSYCNCLSLKYYDSQTIK
jgi:hypothetical protein